MVRGSSGAICNNFRHSAEALAESSFTIESDGPVLTVKVEVNEVHFSPELVMKELEALKIVSCADEVSARSLKYCANSLYIRLAMIFSGSYRT